MVSVEGPRLWSAVAAVVAIVCVAAAMLGMRTGAAVKFAAGGGSADSIQLAAPGIVSQTLGAADPAAYVVRRLRADNAAQRLRATFATGDVTVASGALRVGFTTIAGPPRATGNRVTYTAPGIREWWVNGPLGLEQGFEVAHAPAGAGTGGSLRLLIGVSGDARARATGSGVLLSDGGQMLTYDGLTATDARGWTLAARIVLRGRRIVLAVDARGATYPVRIDPFVEQQKLTVTDDTGGEAGYMAGGGEGFGSTVAMSSDASTLLVGGPSDGDGNGAVWVFVHSATLGRWIEQEKLTASDASGGSKFGSSVAVSSGGNTALIAGPADNSGAGAVWVFSRSGQTWSEVTKLVPGGLASDFGSSVALSGDGHTALIGWPDATTGSTFDDGTVQAYSDASGSWSPYGSPLTGDNALDGEFGQVVALSTDGSTALVGEPGAGSRGEVWVFTNTGSGFALQTSTPLTPTAGPAPCPGQCGPPQPFGTTFALSANGDTALVGDPGDGNEGAVWAFSRAGSAWSAGQPLTASDATFGNAAALSSDGDTALIGAGDYAAPGGASGAAFVFTRSSSDFVLQAGPVSPADETVSPGGSTGLPTSGFGASVALSADGSIGLIGAPGDGAVGAAWVYETSAASGTSPAGTSPAGKSTTTTATVGNQLIMLTSPPASTCTPACEQLSIRFSTSSIPRSRKRKLNFRSVSFVISKRVAPTLRHSTGSVSLSLKGLSKGDHAVEVIVRYKTFYGRHRTAAVTKTIHLSFTVC